MNKNKVRSVVTQLITKWKTMHHSDSDSCEILAEEAVRDLEFIKSLMVNNENDEIMFKPIDEMAYLMIKDEFIHTVKTGGFIDYDGHGYLATEHKESNVRIVPSQIMEDVYPYEWPDWATHVNWYNK